MEGLSALGSELLRRVLPVGADEPTCYRPKPQGNHGGSRRRRRGDHDEPLEPERPGRRTVRGAS